MRIKLFIDYDNLTMPQKRGGLLDVLSKVFLATPLKTNALLGRCEARVYGGWYEGSSLTPLAQRVVAEIQSDFPAVLRCRNKNNDICILTSQAELAYALEEEPTHHLLDTYRKKQLPYNIRATDPKDAGCIASNCALSCLPHLFGHAKCPDATCSVTLGDVLHRAEQKLVDAMMTCDVIHAAEQSHDLIVVVSGDDDLLPAIRTATLRGTPVLRLHPKPFAKVARFPVGGAPLWEQVL